jgi:hypothetical protein
MMIASYREPRSVEELKDVLMLFLDDAFHESLVNSGKPPNSVQIFFYGPAGSCFPYWIQVHAGFSPDPPRAADDEAAGPDDDQEDDQEDDDDGFDLSPSPN